MSQFAIYRNKNNTTQNRIPYLLNVQSNLLDELDTRVVIPLFSSQYAKKMAIGALTPEIEIEGKKHILMTPQIAGISKKDLGELVSSAEHRRDDIIAAIDLLISGI